MSTRSWLVTGTIILMGWVPAGCRREATRGTRPGAVSRGPSSKKGRVSRLVFIDLEKSCPCTKRRIASSLKALGNVLGASTSIPLERYHLDTQAARADVYVDKRPIMVAPALYALDGAGNIIELLQGDITEAQIRGVIQ